MWTTSEDSQIQIDLGQVIRYAQEHYARHTDWYLRHRDTGIKTLVILLTADFTIAGLYFADKVSGLLATCGLGVVGFLSIVLTWLAVMSCRQAYRSSVEHALLVSKAAWALGWCSPITVDQKCVKYQAAPMSADESLYVPRYIKDAKPDLSTEEFVQQCIRRRGTTYFATKWTLFLIGGVAFVIAIGITVAIYKRPNVIDVASNQAVHRIADKPGSR
jgi:hypothetical protein